MDELTPVTRIEQFLDAIVNSGDAPDDAVTRAEKYLDCIYKSTACELEPVTRIEQYLSKISGADVELPDAPVTRIEQYLAKIAGEDVEVPEPVTRVEQWLYDWSGGGDLPWATFTGNPLEFDAPKAHALKSVVVGLEPIQDLHGYDNPWPPGGGENLLDPALQFAATTVSDVQLTTTNGYQFTLNGTATAGGSFGTNTVDLADAVILPAGTYYANAGRYALYNASGTFIKNQYGGTSFTVSEAFYVKRVIFEFSSEKTFNNDQRFIGLKSGSTGLTAWSPYSNECPISGWTKCKVWVQPTHDTFAQADYSISWQTEAGTIYGGTLTVNEDGSGVLTAEWVRITNLATRGAIAVTINNLSCVAVALEDIKSNSNKTNVISSDFKFAGNNASDVVDGGMVNRTGQFYNLAFCSTENFTTVEEFRSYVSDNNVDVVYKLATPVTDNLTPGQVTALVGHNVMWTDGDTLTVEARGTAVT